MYLDQIYFRLDHKTLDHKSLDHESFGPQGSTVGPNVNGPNIFLIPVIGSQSLGQLTFVSNLSPFLSFIAIVPIKLKNGTGANYNLNYTKKRFTDSFLTNRVEIDGNLDENVGIRVIGV